MTGSKERGSLVGFLFVCLFVCFYLGVATSDIFLNAATLLID